MNTKSLGDTGLTPDLGQGNLRLIRDTLARGVTRLAVIMRHSAREFDRNKHDLENPLTEPGRALCREFGDALPKDVHVRGYASPPERCMETASIAIDSHESAGGVATDVRAVESLGVFYALDQIKMWKGMQIAGGLQEYVCQWARGDVPEDAMMPVPLAAKLAASATVARLRTAKRHRHLDLCVSHDISLMMLKAALLDEAPEDYPVNFLEGVVIYELEGAVWMQSEHGARRDITGLIQR